MSSFTFVKYYWGEYKKKEKDRIGVEKIQTKSSLENLKKGEVHNGMNFKGMGVKICDGFVRLWIGNIGGLSYYIKP